jgi:hypothetical protein
MCKGCNNPSSGKDAGSCVDGSSPSCPCKGTTSEGTPINPKGTGSKINIYGEGETPGFQDYATEARFKTGNNGITRPLTSGIPDHSVSDISERDAPFSPATLSEIGRIAAPGCRITYASTQEGIDKEGAKLLAAFPGAKVVERCSAGDRKVLIIELP